MDRAELEHLDREGLVARAQAAGIRRARVLTRPELIDELLRMDPTIDQNQLKKSRGFFGVARDLLSRVVERGLHLPDAADRLRAALGSSLREVARPEPQAVPTVTLAEIYAAQGHKQRAVETLLRVIEAEPDHGAARALLEKLEAASYVAPAPPLPPEPEDAGDEIGARLGAAPAVASEAGEAAPPSHVAAFSPDEAVTIPRAVAPAAREAAPRSYEGAFGYDEAVTLPRPGLPTECVAIPLDGNKVYVWWRLSAEALSRGGAFVVRAVVLVPSWDGPKRETWDIVCDPVAGELVVSDLPEGAVVRVAIGVREGEEVVPLAHSPALESSPAHGLYEWTLKGPSPIVLEDPVAASIARAVEAAARAGLR